MQQVGSFLLALALLAPMGAQAVDQNGAYHAYGLGAQGCLTVPLDKPATSRERTTWIAGYLTAANQHTRA